MTDTAPAPSTRPFPASVFIIWAITPVMTENGLATDSVFMNRYGFFPDGGYAQMFANDLNEGSHSQYEAYREQQELERVARSTEVETAALYDEFNNTLVAHGLPPITAPTVSHQLGPILTYREWVNGARITTFVPELLEANRVAAETHAEHQARGSEPVNAG